MFIPSQLLLLVVGWEHILRITAIGPTNCNDEVVLRDVANAGSSLSFYLSHGRSRITVVKVRLKC
jgi:hypothetical protein